MPLFKYQKHRAVAFMAACEPRNSLEAHSWSPMETGVWTREHLTSSSRTLMMFLSCSSPSGVSFLYWEKRQKEEQTNWNIILFYQVGPWACGGIAAGLGDQLQEDWMPPQADWTRCGNDGAFNRVIAPDFHVCTLKHLHCTARVRFSSFHCAHCILKLPKVPILSVADGSLRRTFKICFVFSKPSGRVYLNLLLKTLNGMALRHYI